MDLTFFLPLLVLSYFFYLSFEVVIVVRKGNGISFYGKRKYTSYRMLLCMPMSLVSYIHETYNTIYLALTLIHSFYMQTVVLIRLV